MASLGRRMLLAPPTVVEGRGKKQCATEATFRNRENSIQHEGKYKQTGRSNTTTSLPWLNCKQNLLSRVVPAQSLLNHMISGKRQFKVSVEQGARRHGSIAEVGPPKKHQARKKTKATLTQNESPENLLKTKERKASRLFNKGWRAMRL